MIFVLCWPLLSSTELARKALKKFLGHHFVPFISVHKLTLIGFYKNRVEATNIQTIEPWYKQLKF